MDRAEERAEYIANGIMMGVQANRYGTVVYNTGRNDFNHGHLKRSALEGYRAAEKDFKLTWKDVRDLLIIAHDYENELLKETPWDGAHDKYTYTEILKRFNERKNKQ